MRKRLTIATLIAAATGCVFGGVILWIAFQLNSQGEYFDPVTGKVDLLQSAELFLAAAFPVTAMVFVVLALGWWVLRIIRRRV